jgi:hypothetical protein
MLIHNLSGLQKIFFDKIRCMVSFLQNMEKEDQRRLVPSWKHIHLPAAEKAQRACWLPKIGALHFR